MKDTTKEKIKKVVGDYIFNNPTEFNDFQHGMKQKRSNLKNKFAETGQDFVERALYEIPETLYNDLFLALTPEEIKEFNTKIGARWFAKIFKEFSLTL